MVSSCVKGEQNALGTVFITGTVELLTLITLLFFVTTLVPLIVPEPGGVNLVWRWLVDNPIVNVVPWGKGGVTLTLQNDCWVVTLGWVILSTTISTK